MYFPAFGLNIFNPIAGKNEPEKLRIRKHFMQCSMQQWQQSIQEIIQKRESTWTKWVKYF